MSTLNGQPDLYTALRALAASEPALGLAEVIQRCDSETRARLLSVDQGLLLAIMRAGWGQPMPGLAQILAHLQAARPTPMFRPDPATSSMIALPTAGQRPDMPAFSDRAFDAWFAAQQVDYGLGLYGEKRSVYQTEQFADAASHERRTIHLGIDIFAAVGTPVYAPLAGKVHHLTYNADPLDYGHTLILQHQAGEVPFYTLYGHLSASLPDLQAPGDEITPSQLIAHLGDWHENGGWAAHIHFQIITDLLQQTTGNFFGVGQESLWDIWQGISPDPNLILRIPAAKFCL